MSKPEKIRYTACLVVCDIAKGRAGTSDRYANDSGQIIRCDPLVILDKRIAKGD